MPVMSAQTLWAPHDAPAHLGEAALVTPQGVNASVTCREGQCRFGDSCAKLGSCLAFDTTTQPRLQAQ